MIMSGYRRSYGRSRRPTVGKVGRVNRRPGNCRTCGELIPAGAGELYREGSGAWSVVHTEPSRGGWLMDPQPVTGGCPESTDKTNAESHARGFFGDGAPLPRSERDRIASAAARYAAQTASAPAPARSGGYRLNSGAVVTGGRCEDAPCCGCCD